MTANEKNEHYGTLNARFDERVAVLFTMGYRQVQLEDYGVSLFVKPRGGKKHSLPASFLMHADAVCWADKLEECKRFF